MVQMKNRVSELLMETGVEYNNQWLHKVSYFRELHVNGPIDVLQSQLVFQPSSETGWNMHLDAAAFSRPLWEGES
jgi:hypothetical protein